MVNAAKDITILVVDDQPRIRRYVRMEMERIGWRVVEAADGGQAIARARDSAPDCMLLDLMLPDLDGFDVVHLVREFSDVPIIMLTARDSEDSRVRGLDLGADDYVIKPFGMRELIARVRANLRRAADHPAPPSQPFRLDGLTVDFAKHRVLVDNRPVVLTPTEFGLLAELIRHAGAVLMPADLLRAVSGPAYVDDFGLLRTAVWRLRRKLEPNPKEPASWSRSTELATPLVPGRPRLRVAGPRRHVIDP